ncbi:hypothetical protein [Nonomuraea endophytica]|uniref:Uncharacterized protein n=1 Tax=Nonomuraea endophytica TaxID=714136 RepID=A0A7W8AA44_9ACTN|nr:hypothetical protein [Nonomuraea endophytica]MBB5082350.1 hypothetical protein [Nonomuraea endophytica]
MSGWKGFTQGEMRLWRRAGFGEEEAAAWREAGVEDPDDARLWRTTGATPAGVVSWQRGGLTPRDAVRWHELGVAPREAAARHLAGERPHRVSLPARLFPGIRLSDLAPGPTASLRTLLRAGVPVDVARAYTDAGWDGDAARDWAERRIPPAEAEVFRAMGFTAAEAARAGRPPMEVLAAWWGAVPLDEVAAWCAAGLGPREAAAQRAAGVTAEQAAVLRALR